MSKNFELLNRLDKMRDVLPGIESEIPTLQAVVSVPEVDAVEAPEVSVGPPLLALDTTAQEAIIKLVHRLFSPNKPGSAKCVVFTCPESGGGTTWMCSHVADMLASQLSSSICIVDCNFRCPALHQQFDVENRSGLADALQSSRPIREYVQQLRSNLWMITSGSSSEDASQFLVSERMRVRIAELRATFDYVLFDSPSLSSCNHGLVLGGLSDGVALVLKANSTRRNIARLALKELQSAQVTVLGAVLNQRTFPIPANIYNRI